MSEILYQAYMKAPLTDEERNLVEKEKKTWIQKGFFSRELSFGTGGMRQTVGPGVNQLNNYNISRLTSALAVVLKKHYKNNIKVAIAFDSRLSSESFSRVTWHILDKAGFKVYIFKRPTPTPLLSFAVRELECSAGIVLTASHNPPEYNGYKVYWNDGGQIINPFDKEIEQEYLRTDYSTLDNNTNKYSQTEIPRSSFIEEEIISRYIMNLKKENFAPDNERNLSILYSPLHGTGAWSFKKVFQEFGFKNFKVLSSQEQPDGHFPLTKSPNPEDESSFELLKAEGIKNKIEMLIASDPDADRMGCAVLNNSNYVMLNGNQIGALMLNFMIKSRAHKLEKPYICKTIVTSPLQNYIAQKNNIRVKETLTGFKYIAGEIAQDPENYLFGGEESFGYLPINWVRDKDSISSALVFCLMSEQTPPLQQLQQIYMEYGFFYDLLYTISLTQNPDLMENILLQLHDPATLFQNGFGTRKRLDILDLRKNGKNPETETLKYLKNNLEPSTVIQYHFSDDTRLTIRPSGTEPKIKIYINLRHPGIYTVERAAQMEKELANEAESMYIELKKLLNIE